MGHEMKVEKIIRCRTKVHKDSVLYIGTSDMWTFGCFIKFCLHKYLSQCSCGYMDLTSAISWLRIASLLRKEKGLEEHEKEQENDETKI